MNPGLLLVLLLFVLPAVSWAKASSAEFGVRGGSDATSVAENYAAGEVYFLQDLPWQKELRPGMRMHARLDMGGGYLSAASERGGWLAVGGNLVLTLPGGRWALDGGLRPAWLFRDKFGKDDYGGPVQFASHVGVTLHLGQFALSYRFQHLSNANLYDKNSGLDLHLFGLGMRF